MRYNSRVGLTQPWCHHFPPIRALYRLSARFLSMMKRGANGLRNAKTYYQNYSPGSFYPRAVSPCVTSWLQTSGWRFNMQEWVFSPVLSQWIRIGRGSVKPYWWVTAREQLSFFPAHPQPGTTIFPTRNRCCRTMLLALIDRPRYLRLVKHLWE